MDLIERYVNEVGRHLPRGQRDEVRRELRASLHDSLEGRVDGEPTETDAAALLEELGHPRRVAASYRPASQYLIGPRLYADFRRVALIVLAVLAALLTAGFAVTLFLQPPGDGVGERLLDLVFALLDALLPAFAVVVLIFAALERLDVVRELEPAWDPRKLPAVPDADVFGRGEAILTVVVTGLFLGFLNLFSDRLGIAVNPGGRLLLNDVLTDNLVWLNTAGLLVMALHVWLLRAGRWHLGSRLAKVAVDLCVVYAFYRVAAGVDASRPALAEAGLSEPLPNLVIALAWMIPAVAALATAIDAGRVLHRTLRAGGSGASTARAAGVDASGPG